MRRIVQHPSVRIYCEANDVSTTTFHMFEEHWNDANEAVVATTRLFIQHADIDFTRTRCHCYGDTVVMLSLVKEVYLLHAMFTQVHMQGYRCPIMGIWITGNLTLVFRSAVRVEKWKGLLFIQPFYVVNHVTTGFGINDHI